MKRVLMVICFLFIAAGIGARVACLFRMVPFDGDLAVFGLMAKHISEGSAFPVYMPLLHYAGSLGAFMGAGLFKVFGLSYNAFGTVGIIYSLFWVFFTFLLGRKVTDRAGVFFTIAFSLIPPFGLLYYSLFTGVHAENLVFIPLILLFAIKWEQADHGDERPFLLAAGFISGLGLWSTPGALPAITVAVFVFFVNGRGSSRSLGALLFFALGFLAGYAPAIAYNFEHPMATAFRMLGRVFGLDRSVLVSPDPIGEALGGAWRRLLSVPASLFRIPRLLAGLIGLPNLAVFAAAAAWAWKKRRANGLYIFIVYAAVFAAFYSLLIGEDSPRYMVGLAVIVPILTGKLLSDLRPKRPAIFIALFCALIASNAYGIYDSLSEVKSPPYGELVKWLGSRDIKSGFSGYNISYAVTFLSGEKITMSPTLYRRDFCDRYPGYTLKARKDPRAVFVVDMDKDAAAAAVIEARLAARGARYEKKDIGLFTIFYNMSIMALPEDLGLYER